MRRTRARGPVSRISTGTGDDGTTGLVGGKRVKKSSIRVEAYGAVDEVNDCVGLAASLTEDSVLREVLATIQEELFTLGADLAAPGDVPESATVRITTAHVSRIAAETDRLEAALPSLTRFILPGGSPSGAALHLARSVSRRAERAVWRLHETDPVNPHTFVYLNRLSDYLFLLARETNRAQDSRETEWKGRSGAAATPE